MKRAIVTCVWRGDELHFDVKADPGVSQNELNWALDQLKLQLLTGRSTRNLASVVPGMLTPDLKRLPAETQKALARVVA